MWQQQIQRNYQNKGSRTPKEYQQIYNDLIEYRKVGNLLHEKGSFSFKFWKQDIVEKRKEFYQEFVDTLQELAVSGKIKSCECQQDLRQAISRWEEIRDQKNNLLNPIGAWALHSSKDKPNWSIYTHDELIEKLEKINIGTATQQEIDNVDKSLDSFSNCVPIAHFQELNIEQEIDLKSLGITNGEMANNKNNLSRSPKSPFKC